MLENCRERTVIRIYIRSVPTSESGHLIALSFALRTRDEGPVGNEFEVTESSDSDLRQAVTAEVTTTTVFEYSTISFGTADMARRGRRWLAPMRTQIAISREL